MISVDEMPGGEFDSVSELADEVVTWLDEHEQFAVGLTEAVANRLGTHRGINYWVQADEAVRRSL